MGERFEWEKIETPEGPTGVDPLDKALAYNDPVGFLKEHFARREDEDGREGVIADLEKIVGSTPAGSPAHDGCAVWLDRYRQGASIAEL